MMGEAKGKVCHMLSCEHCSCPTNRGQGSSAWLHINYNGIVNGILKNDVFPNSGTIDPLSKSLFGVGSNPVNSRMLAPAFSSQKPQFWQFKMSTDIANIHQGKISLALDALCNKETIKPKVGDD